MRALLSIVGIVAAAALLFFGMARENPALMFFGMILLPGSAVYGMLGAKSSDGEGAPVHH